MWPWRHKSGKIDLNGAQPRVSCAGAEQRNATAANESRTAGSGSWFTFTRPRVSLWHSHFPWRDTLLILSVHTPSATDKRNKPSVPKCLRSRREFWSSSCRDLSLESSLWAHSPPESPGQSVQWHAESERRGLTCIPLRGCHQAQGHSHLSRWVFNIHLLTV